jgi:hypothetical protein
MDTFFDDHVRDGLSDVGLLSVLVLLDGEFEGGSSDVLDSHGDWMATVETKWAEDHDRSVKLASDWHLEPFGHWALLELVITELDHGLVFNGLEHSVLVQIGSGESFPFSAVDLELPRGLSIAA